MTLGSIFIFPSTNYCQVYSLTPYIIFKLLSIDIIPDKPRDRASTLWPGKYLCMLAKGEIEQKKAHHEDAIECQSESSGQLKRSVKAHRLARMINLEAVASAVLS